MTTATALLNMIAAETGSTDKNEVITLAIGMLVKMGAPIEQAVDAILGAGAYKKLAEQVWTTLRAAQGL